MFVCTYCILFPQINYCNICIYLILSVKHCIPVYGIVISELEVYISNKSVCMEWKLHYYAMPIWYWFDLILIKYKYIYNLIHIYGRYGNKSDKLLFPTSDTSPTIIPCCWSGSPGRDGIHSSGSIMLSVMWQFLTMSDIYVRYIIITLTEVYNGQKQNPPHNPIPAPPSLMIKLITSS